MSHKGILRPTERNVWVLCNYATEGSLGSRTRNYLGSRTRNYQVLRGNFAESLAILRKIFSPPEDFVIEILEIGLEEDIARRGVSMNEIRLTLDRVDGSLVGEVEYWGEEQESKM